MASFVYTNAMLQMLTSGSPSPLPMSGGYASSSSNPDYQIMLLQGTSQDPSNKGDTTVSAHLTAAELVATGGYTAGWSSTGSGTAGRQVCHVTASIASNVINIQLNAGAAFTWTSVTGSNPVTGAALIKTGSANDTTGIPIAYWDLTATPITPNGSNIQVTVDATKNITFTT